LSGSTKQQDTFREFLASFNYGSRMDLSFTFLAQLSDVSLAGDEDGLELVRWMRTTKQWRKTPVIATTAYAFTGDRDNCLATGCNDYLSKPVKERTC